MRLVIVASHPIQYQAPLFRELARRMDVEVFFAHRPSERDQAAAGFDVGFTWDVDLLAGYSHTFLENVSAQPSLEQFTGCDTPAVGSLLARGRFDALLVMGWHLKCFWQAIWGAKRARIPVMVRGDSHLETPRNLVKRAGKAAVYPLALRVFDAALYVGERSRRYWAHYGYPASRMFFSPHCVDNDWFAGRATLAARKELRAAHGFSPQTKALLFAGKLLDFKRAGDLVSAAAMLMRAGHDIGVLIAGSGPMANDIEARRLATGVNVVQLGFCNQARMPAVYAAADVLVLPSEHETWGLVANEALACGLPIVVSDHCGCAPDLATDGLVGRVVPVGNIDALAAGLEELLQAPPPREAILARAARYAVGPAADGVEAAMLMMAPQERAKV